MTALRPGDRVQITGVMPEDPDPLPIGTTGTVVRLLDSGWQADVDWDNGRGLLLLLDVDPYRVVGTTPMLPPTCAGMASNGLDDQEGQN